jgi:hypothetical protein
VATTLTVMAGWDLPSRPEPKSGSRQERRSGDTANGGCPSRPILRTGRCWSRERPGVELGAGGGACIASLGRPAAQEGIKPLMARGFQQAGGCRKSARILPGPIRALKPPPDAVPNSGRCGWDALEAKPCLPGHGRKIGNEKRPARNQPRFKAEWRLVLRLREAWDDQGCGVASATFASGGSTITWTGRESSSQLGNAPALAGVDRLLMNESGIRDTLFVMSSVSKGTIDERRTSRTEEL